MYSLPDNLQGQFDIVYTSYGVVFWLPDVRRWAEVAARFVKPGGFFYIAEFHPFCSVFHNEDANSGLEIRYPYFEGEARSHFGQLDRSRANADKVLLLASIWSLDPSSIDDSALTDAVGIAGDLSRARPR